MSSALQNVATLNRAHWMGATKLSGGSYGFNYPIGVATDGSHVWVANDLGQSITELSATSGSYLKTLSGGSMASTTSSSPTTERTCG